MVLIYNCLECPMADTSTYAWSGLRHFQHTQTLLNRIREIHNIEDNQRKNAQKQAEQIRYCLMQALEYRNSSQAVSLSTKSVLMYYSIMSLALAQILLSGNGHYSLDAARAQNRHHGLILAAGHSAHDSELSSAATALRAFPMIANDQRRGTFELWHQVAREHPLCGINTRNTNGAAMSGPQALLCGQDKRLGYLSTNGITLMDCFQSCPGMLDALPMSGQQSEVVRGRISLFSETNEKMYELIIHPQHNAVLNEFYEQIKLQAESVNFIDITELTSGIALRWNQKIKYISLPPASNITKSEIRFLGRRFPLNEFGYFYIGLYILGNYSRYFPDKWMRDVEGNTPLAQAAHEFITLAERRMALLTLSELLGKYILERD